MAYTKICVKCKKVSYFKEISSCSKKKNSNIRVVVSKQMYILMKLKEKIKLNLMKFIPQLILKESQLIHYLIVIYYLLMEHIYIFLLIMNGDFIFKNKYIFKKDILIKIHFLNHII